MLGWDVQVLKLCSLIYNVLFPSPSMRPRHWKQVLRFAKSGPVHLLGRSGAFDLEILDELTFGQLLDMELHGKLT